jgi:hypothetical protein
MAQTGFTPIQLYSSSTTGNTPAAADLLNSSGGSELAINIFDGKLFYKDNAGAVQVIGWKVVPVSAGGTGVTSASITAFNNITGYTATGATGTTSSNLVFSTSPTLITPALGTPSALVGTNITGTASGLTAGNVTTNANLTGPITSIGNATSIASQTGTGTKFVVDTSPTLVTPVLGVATATSINFGGTALSVYTEGTWTPVIADAPTGGNTGTAIVQGFYTKVGRVVTLSGHLININTTGMTAGNAAYIRGLPFAAITVSNSIQVGSILTNVVTLTAGAPSVYLSSNTSYLALGNAASTGDPILVSDITSTTADIYFTITYTTA